MIVLHLRRAVVVGGHGGFAPRTATLGGANVKALLNVVKTVSWRRSERLVLTILTTGNRAAIGGDPPRHEA